MAVAGLVAFTAHAVLGTHAGPDLLFDGVLYNVISLGAAAACGLRAVLRPRDRGAWAAITVALACSAAGDLAWTLSFDGTAPAPNWTDALYLATYPGLVVGLVLLVRADGRRFGAETWLDALIVALAFTAVAAAVTFEVIAGSAAGSSLATAITIAYPVGDLLVTGIVVAGVGLLGWRPGRAWLALAAGVLMLTAADIAYLYETASGGYVSGGSIDALWLGAAALVGCAAWVAPPSSRPRPPAALSAVIPALGGVISLALVTVGLFGHLSYPGSILTIATLVAVTARLVLAHTAAQRASVASRREARTDSLTGLHNRRALLEDLEAAGERATFDEPMLLVLSDLDGFKGYNDSFGHPAGDRLLERVGRQLGGAVAGVAYRLGGDEFCVLQPVAGRSVEALTAEIGAALAEDGGGFRVRCTSGAVLIPAEASTVAGVLALADRRMYAAKPGNREEARREASAVLLRTLNEREPGLKEHVSGVAVLADAIGRRLGLDDESLDELRRAAELHDIGKLAIPDAILAKTGPLTPEEWRFMRRHTIIGERILAGAPAMAQVARIVRSSHERWDGGGYPDGLRGPEIPLGARVVAACDAYNAMVTDRPYRGAISSGDALDELARCAGTQFDPAVVAEIRLATEVEALSE